MYLAVEATVDLLRGQALDFANGIKRIKGTWQKVKRHYSTLSQAPTKRKRLAV